jgi:hypothetical protein
MSTILTARKERRGPTSLYLDRGLWTVVRKTSIDLGITATEFVEAALKEELKRVEDQRQGKGE